MPEVPDVPDVEVSAADQILEVEALQSEIDVLMGQVRALKARGKLKHLQLICLPCTEKKPRVFLGRLEEDSRIEEDREEERQQEVENRMQHLHVPCFAEVFGSCS